MAELTYVEFFNIMKEIGFDEFKPLGIFNTLQHMTPETSVILNNIAECNGEETASSVKS